MGVSHHVTLAQTHPWSPISPRAKSKPPLGPEMPPAPCSFLSVFLPHVKRDSTCCFLGLAHPSPRSGSWFHHVNQMLSQCHLPGEASLSPLPCPQYPPPLSFPLQSLHLYSLCSFVLITTRNIYIPLYIWMLPDSPWEHMCFRNIRNFVCFVRLYLQALQQCVWHMVGA